MTVHLAETPVIETERLILRAPQSGDGAPGAAFLASERARYMGGPLSPHQAWRSMGHLIGHWVLRGFGLFVLCDRTTGAPLGACGPWYPDGWAEPEIGWALWAPEAEGRGLAREAVLAARAHAYAALGWTTAVSYIDPGNTRSIALAERLGAARDRDAKLPDLPGWEGTLVFRHPGPEART